MRASIWMMLTVGGAQAALSSSPLVRRDLSAMSGDFAHAGSSKLSRRGLFGKRKAAKSKPDAAGEDDDKYNTQLEQLKGDSVAAKGRYQAGPLKPKEYRKQSSFGPEGRAALSEVVKHFVKGVIPGDDEASQAKRTKVFETLKEDKFWVAYTYDTKGDGDPFKTILKTFNVIVFSKDKWEIVHPQQHRYFGIYPSTGFQDDSHFLFGNRIMDSKIFQDPKSYDLRGPFRFDPKPAIEEVYTKSWLDVRNGKKKEVAARFITEFHKELNKESPEPSLVHGKGGAK